MHFTIAHSPTFSTLEARFEAGEVLHVQPGAMLAMSTGFELRAMLGGHVGGRSRGGRAIRSMLAGESAFASVYTATRDEQWLLLGPDTLGELVELEVTEDRQYFLARGAWLAGSAGVQLRVEYAGVRGWMATSGLFFLRATGQGSVFVASHGALVRRQLAEDERVVLDNRCLVAFSAGLRFETVKVARGLGTSFLAGEGLANRFTGPGELIHQTRQRPAGGLLRGILDVAT
jgi:uncharacterized protein (TIGR00266 family)